MPIYKCNECSHEYSQLSKPTDCEVCGANNFKIVEEKKDLESEKVKILIPSFIEKTILNENIVKQSVYWSPISRFARFKDGCLFQEVSKPNWGEWSVLNANYLPDNIQKTDYSIDVKKVDGPKDCLYGILTTIKESKFYYLLITSDGYFSMGKHSKSKWNHYIDREKHSSINQGNSINKLRVVTEGNLITGFINGKKVESFRDDLSPYKSTNIGVYSASSIQGNGVAVYFNKVKVTTTVLKY